MTTLLDSTKKDIDDHINKAINEYLGLETNTSNKFSIDGKNVDFSRITNNSADSLNGKFWSEDNIHKDRWGDNKSGKLEYEIKEDLLEILNKEISLETAIELVLFVMKKQM